MSNYLGYSEYSVGIKYPTIGGSKLKWIDTSSDNVEFNTKQSETNIIKSNDNMIISNNMNVKRLYKRYRIQNGPLYYDDFIKRVIFIYKIWSQDELYDNSRNAKQIIDNFITEMEEILLNIRTEPETTNKIYGKETTLTGMDWINIKKRKELTSNIVEYLYSSVLRRKQNNNIRSYSNTPKFLDSDDITKNLNSHQYGSKESPQYTKKTKNNVIKSPSLSTYSILMG